MQSLSNLKVMPENLVLNKSTNKASAVEIICKTIYQNNNMLEEMMKLLNEDTASDFLQDGHTYTIIDDEQEQQNSTHCITVSPNKGNTTR